MNESNSPAIQPELKHSESTKLRELRLRRASPKPDGRNAYEQLKIFIVEQLSVSIDNEPGILHDADSRTRLLKRFDEILAEGKIILKRSERWELFEDIRSEVMNPGSQDDADSSS